MRWKARKVNSELSKSLLSHSKSLKPIQSSWSGILTPWKIPTNSKTKTKCTPKLTNTESTTKSTASSSMYPLLTLSFSWKESSMKKSSKLTEPKSSKKKLSTLTSWSKDSSPLSTNSFCPSFSQFYSTIHRLAESFKISFLAKWLKEKDLMFSSKTSQDSETPKSKSVNWLISLKIPKNTKPSEPKCLKEHF